MFEFGAWASENPALSMREDDLARMESFLEACFHSSTLGFCILDAELRYVTINQTLAKMNGMSPEAHVGKTIREVPGPFADQVEPDLRRVLVTREPLLDVRLSGAVPQTNEPGHWIDHYFPIKFGEGGRVERIGVFVVEVTQHKQMEATVSHLSKSVKEQMDRLQMLMDVGSILASNWNIAQVFPRISVAPPLAALRNFFCWGCWAGRIDV
jgi:PAS domain S-box-containing protein